MHWLWPEWDKVFILDAPLLEPILRGVLVYVGLLIVVRVLPRREAGTVALTDFLVAALIADAVSNGMTGGHESVPAALLTGGTILACTYLMDWLTYHSPFWRRLVDRPPVALIRNGRVLGDNLRGQLVTEDELLSQLRQHGVERPEQVKLATIEGDGEVSVIEAEGGTTSRRSAGTLPRARTVRDKLLKEVLRRQEQIEGHQRHIDELLARIAKA